MLNLKSNENSNDLSTQLQAVFQIACSGIAEIGSVIHNVDGFLTLGEGATLFSCARYGAGNGVIAEIGSFKGKSTIWMACGSKGTNREKVHAIDPHCGSEEHQEGGFFNDKMPENGTTFYEFKKNLESFNLSDWVTPHVGFSHEIVKNWKHPIRLLFIDGDHSEAAVERDFLDWEPFVSPNGIIAFHDVETVVPAKFFPGPQNVTNKYVKNNARFKPLFHVDSLFLALKLW